MQSVADEKRLSEFWISGRFIPAYPYAYPNRMGVRHVSWPKNRIQDPQDPTAKRLDRIQDPYDLIT